MRARKRISSGDRRAGYTVTELLIVAALVGLTALLAAANHFGRLPHRRLERATLELAADLRAARMRAISENVPVTVTFDAANRQYMLWADSNTNGTMDAGECESKSFADVHDLRMTVRSPCGAFLPSGAFAASNGCGEAVLTIANVGTNGVRILPRGQVDWIEGVDASGPSLEPTER